MKKVQVLFTGLVLVSLLGGFLAGCTGKNAADGDITIAVADSTAFDEDGNINPASYYAGALMAFNQANDKGGVNEFSFSVKSYDDQNDPALAAEKAREIVSSPALAVIGHASSEATSSAAPIYDEAAIPAINVIPLDASLTEEHKSYFNISQTANIEAIYIANYLVKVLKQVDGEGNVIPKYATLIYTNDEKSLAEAEAFRNTFRGLGGSIAIEHKVLSEGTIDSQLEGIAANIVGLDTSVTPPGTIFIAMPGETAAKMVEQIKRKGLAYPIAGGSSLASEAFTNYINGLGEESTQPGYFTDGILTVRAVIGDSIQGQTRNIFDLYARQYPKAEGTPSDAFLSGYEAALALMGAVRKASLGGDTTANRAEIMKTLASLGEGEDIQGINGPIVFQQNRNAIRTPRFGTYQNGQLISAMTQFKRIGAMQYSENLKQQLESGRIMTVDGEYVNVVNVVYTGIDLLSVREVDIKTSTYKLDFYLWFRYRENADGQFQPDNYNFTNVEGIDSDALVGEETSGGITLKTYRIQGLFKNQFNFQDYPFDRQLLTMQLRNKDATTSEVQYVVDKLGMKYSSNQDLLSYWQNKNQAFEELFGWKAQDARAEQQIFSTSSTLGNPQNFDQSGTTDFSLFNVSLEIQRDSLSFIIKSLLPLLITLVLAYITFFLPLGHSERLGVGSTALLTTAFFHLNLASALPEIGYTVAMEYFFYASYLMSALIVFLETLSIRLEKMGEDEKDEAKKSVFEKKRNNLNMAGRVAYPAILGLAVLLGVFVGMGVLSMSPDTNPFSRDLVTQLTEPVATPAPAKSQTPETQAKNSDTKTLVLMTWRPEDTKEMETILAAFSEYALKEHNLNIKIKYEPVMGVNYDAILRAKFEDKSGVPDLVYVRPYAVDGEIAEYLVPMDTEQLLLQDKYKPQMLEPWLAASGKYYGIPFGGVVQGVYYNKDLFEQAKVAIPQTWSEFILAAQKLQAYSDSLEPAQRFVPIANGLNTSQDSEMFQSIIINFIGGADGRRELLAGELCFDTPRIINAFAAIRQMQPYLPADAAGLTAETSKELFFKQKAAMLFGGSWDIKLVQRQAAGFEWGVFAPPAQSGKTYVIFNPDAAIGINKNSAYLPEARMFAEWLTTQQAVDLIAENLPGFYPLRDLAPAKAIEGEDAEFLNLANNYEADARWVYIDISSQYPRADEIVRISLYDILKNDLRAGEAAARLQTGLSEWFTPAQICKPK